MEHPSNRRNRAESREEAPRRGLLVLVAEFRPFLALFVALVLAIIILAITAGRFSLTLTECTYFLLAPYYAGVIVAHGRDFFGCDKRSVAAAVAFAIIAAALLYASDAAIRFFALGHIRVALTPAPGKMILLATSGAIVETVVVQLGVQARIRGWTGVAIAAILFFVLHLTLNPIFLIAGIVLALLQTVTRRPGSTLIAHLLYNGLISFVPPL